ncbi:MAG TPA: cobalamin-dependent protein, partial [Anaerolineales bacterium]|nr:cobalamin-dependent protein [Anaerolineales bacterium]
MKITLIEPAMIKNQGFSEKPSWQLTPLTLATLAGITPPDVEVEVLDDRIEEIDFDAPRDLVGISVKTFTARRAYQIADEFRRRGVPVILGGHHPTLLPEEALRYADS